MSPGQPLYFDYQRYDLSQGVSSEKSTYPDARAARQCLMERSDVNSPQIVYIGCSLGAAMAVELTVSGPAKGMMLVSSFSSASGMAQLPVAFPMAE